MIPHRKSAFEMCHHTIQVFCCIGIGAQHIKCYIEYIFLFFLGNYFLSLTTLQLHHIGRKQLQAIHMKLTILHMPQVILFDRQRFQIHIYIHLMVFIRPNIFRRQQHTQFSVNIIRRKSIHIQPILLIVYIHFVLLVFKSRCLNGNVLHTRVLT